MLQRLTQNSDPMSPWRLWVNQFLSLQCPWQIVLSLVKWAEFLWVCPSLHSAPLSFNFLSESYRNDNSHSAGSLPGLKEMWWGNCPGPSPVASPGPPRPPHAPVHAQAQPRPQPNPGGSDSGFLPQHLDFYSRWNVLINFESGYFELSKKL